MATTIKWRASGPAGETRWYASREEAWAAYERLSKRTGEPCRLHAPGDVAGDGFESNLIQGPGPGGMYYLESRKA
jgi:hypothetical protein